MRGRKNPWPCKSPRQAPENFGYIGHALKEHVPLLRKLARAMANDSDIVEAVRKILRKNHDDTADNHGY